MVKRKEWIMAFRSRFGRFESLVMLFGVNKALASFQHFINNIHQKYLDIFCTAYIDDIPASFDTMQEHHIHVRRVLESLKKAVLYLKPEKCEFPVRKTKYIRLILSADGISMDPAMVITVQNWTALKSGKGVQT